MKTELLLYDPAISHLGIYPEKTAKRYINPNVQHCLQQPRHGNIPSAHQQMTGIRCVMYIHIHMCMCIYTHNEIIMDFSSGTMVKNLPANAGDVRDANSIPGSEDSLEEGMATHSSILAWKIPRREEPGGPQSKGSQRVEHD